MSLNLISVGHAHAKNVITNKFLEDLDIGTNAQWIEEKIGIIERVTTLPLDYIKDTRNVDPREARYVAAKTPVDLAVEASQMALDRVGLKASDIGLVICNACNPELTAPTTSQMVSERLGVSIKSYEVMSACPAFALQMDYLNSFEEAKLPKFILCISSAALTQNVNYNERSDGAIWGDGAAAWIISPTEKGKLKLIDTVFETDPTRSQSVVVSRFWHFWQDGRAVRDFSVRQTVRLLKRLESDYNLNWEKDVFIGHQANRTMLSQITNNRNIPDYNHWHNVSYLGNQAGAGAPATLSMHWDKVVPGNRLAVAVVGAGLSWGSVLMETI